jgi:molybdopterin molybdotransferase
MITASEALQIVLENAPRLEAVEVPLLESLGGVLAAPVAADIDLPPFDKSAMDGYAVRAADLKRLPADLRVVEELPAGTDPARAVAEGTCAKIMTGAPVPPGGDLVVPVEDTQPLLEGRVRILRARSDRTNICPRGEDVEKGAVVLEAGRVIRPPEIGLLASVGRERVLIHRRPRVAVLATGEELVPISAAPGPGRIRNSNSWSLLASCRRAGAEADDLGVARDVREDLAAKIADGLRRDILLVSGGVSMGEWDLVPRVLEEMGAAIRFATVRMKPGKPTVFATRGAGLVFGLPGNPVSTLVTFRLFVWPAIRKMMGHPDAAPAPLEATLAAAVSTKDDRTWFMPARLRREGQGWMAAPVRTHGSADLVGFSRADFLAVIEPGSHAAGARVKVLPLEI